MVPLTRTRRNDVLEGGEYGGVKGRERWLETRECADKMPSMMLGVCARRMLEPRNLLPA